MDRTIDLASLGRAAGGGVTGDPTTRVAGITYDSRLVQPGFLFAALRGAEFDGHTYVQGAVNQGAAALLVDHPVDLPVPQLVVADTRASLAPVAATFYDHPSAALTVIGITGTDGKTTTSHIVDALLRGAGRRTGMIGTVALRIGDRVEHHESRQTTPESADVQGYLREMVEAGVEVAVVEATSHGLDLHRLDETRFAIAAVTNITHEHLEHHGTIAAYRRAKGILFERVAAAGGPAVINIDDAGATEMLRYTGSSPVLSYSLERAADVWCRELRLGNTGSTFELITPVGAVTVTLPLIGAFNVANALCAAAIGIAAGLDLRSIAEGLATIAPIPGRMAIVDEGQPFRVVVDYAHTPDSLTKVLNLLRGLNPDGRIILVMGSAGQRDVEKRALQGAVAARLADLSFFTSEDPRFEDANAIIADIASGAIAAGGVDDSTFFRVTERADAVELAIGAARPGDSVVLAGKGHERSIIVGHDKLPWDDAAAAKAALGRIGYRRD